MSVAAQSLSSPAEASNAGRWWWPGAAARASGIAALAIAGIFTHLALRWGSDVSPAAKALPLYVVLAGGGVPLVLSLGLKLARREFGSDLLAGISIVAAVLLQEYLAGALVVLMLSGGEALEGSHSAARPQCCRRSPGGCRSLPIAA
jgi:cation transport ATPase